MIFFSLLRAPGMRSPNMDSAPASTVEFDAAWWVDLSDSRKGG